MKNKVESVQQNRIKFLLKDSIVYGGANALNAVFMMFAFPFLTRYLSVEEFGIYDSLNILVNVLILAVVWGQESALARYFYEYDEKNDKKIIVSSSLLIQLIFIIVLFPLFFYFSDDLSLYYLNTNKYNELMPYILLQIPVGMLINYTSNILKWTFSKYKFLLLNIGSLVFSFSGIIIGIKYFQVDLVDIFIIILSTRSVFAIIGLIFVFEWLEFKKDSKILKELFYYALPLGLVSFISAISPVFERGFITNYLTEDKLGIYAIAFRVAFIIQLPIQAFTTAWGPFSLSIFKEKDSEETYNIVLNLYIMLVSISGLFLIFGTDLIVLILSSTEYLDASYFVFIIVLGSIIQSISWITSLGITISKKSHLRVYSYIAKNIGELLILIFFITEFNLFAVAISYLAGNIVLFLIELFLSYKSYTLRFNFSNTIFILSLFSILSMSFYFIREYDYLIQFGLFSLLITFFILMMYYKVLNKQNPVLLFKKYLF